ncbi:uracil-DNA glycosylase [Promethearchaeum syntrophicum]|uniref:Uracil-DNA glycosylase n=1 Tax=Promethearchaeum syntrophicum TaxID=2594042 RepID=A0A5B9D6T2_9ARCH|nr:uracil-DNA glycosylase [Candidatus Prometheoarchaeum syntrophicum]
MTPNYRICKWYYCCPIKYFTDEKKLDSYWVDNYCLIGNTNCIRYQKEEAGVSHPDNLLPDGSIDSSLV